MPTTMQNSTSITKSSRNANNGRRRIVIIRRRRRRVPPHLGCAILGMLLRILLLTAPNNIDPSTHHRILLADAFASNLVETGIGCMTDLSTDEVIMNEEVKPPEESDFPKMKLAVLDASDHPIESSTYKYDPTVPTIKIAFVNPYPTSEFNDDLQFVIEVNGKTEDSRDAEFISGGPIGCDNNKRVSNRLLTSQAAVVLQINDPSARLRIWGGWATGHNAVRLLPDLILEPGEAGSATAAEKKEETIEEAIEELEEEIEEEEEEILEEEFQNTDKEKLLRDQEEAKLEKILHGEPVKKEDEEESPPDKKEETIEELEEEIEEEEEEILEEKFQNTDKEKLLRNQEEAKLEKLLGGEEKVPQQEKRALQEETAKPKPKHTLQRKRKNVLNKPDSVPEGLIDSSKQKKDLGLEIARKDRERGKQGGDVESETKSIQQKIKEKQINLDVNAIHNNNNNNNNNDQKQQQQKKKLHKLTDHTDRERERRDIPESVQIYDDVTDDDLPEVVHEEVVNDDFLPDEGHLDDAQFQVSGAMGVRGRKDTDTEPHESEDSKPHESSSSSSSGGGLELQHVLETSHHFAACAFFVASMGLFWLVFGKKRHKGRRDL